MVGWQSTKTKNEKENEKENQNNFTTLSMPYILPYAERASLRLALCAGLLLSYNKCYCFSYILSSVSYCKLLYC